MLIIDLMLVVVVFVFVLNVTDGYRTISARVLVP